MKIDHEKLDSIRRELEDIVYPGRRDESGQLKIGKHDCQFKLRKDCDGVMGSGVRQYQRGDITGFDCYINPRRIHTENQLRQHVDHIKEALL